MEQTFERSYRPSQAHRIVIKLGTQVVIEEDGKLARQRLSSLIESVGRLKSAGREMLLVSSGAVGLGQRCLRLEPPLSVTDQQACAAVGQTLLINAYRRWFSKLGFDVAQILLTAHDFSNRRSFLNLKSTLKSLLAHNVVPIINENDTVSTLELRGTSAAGKSFGDNDKLSALVASKLDADLLIILTDVDGIYDCNPKSNQKARNIPIIRTFQELNAVAGQGTSTYGRGGIHSKVESAKIASLSGVPCIIANGHDEEVLSRVFSDHPTGTLVLPQSPKRDDAKSLSKKKQWIGWSSGYAGVLSVNEGAAHALRAQGASLLPVGVVGVEGTFGEGSTVSIRNSGNEEIGRGLVNFSSDEIRRILGKRSSDVPAVLGRSEAPKRVVRRDRLVIFEDVEPGD